MTIGTHQIVSAIHSGLGEAWLTAFLARGTPNVEVKPEYLATVMVGRALINEWSLSDAKMGLEFEANACHVATKCFPPRFPPLKRRIPARRTGKKFDREKVDIVIFERPDSWSSLAIQQGHAVGLACVADGIVHNIPPRRNPAHLTTLYDTLEAVLPQGETGLVAILHELAETVRQRALVIVISDLFVEPESLRECFEHLRFRKHDVTAFHLLDPEELAFAFQRPTRFLDMEGGTAVFADPVEIAERYHTALSEYLEALRKVVLETAVDYRRISIDSPYAQEQIGRAACRERV